MNYEDFKKCHKKYHDWVRSRKEKKEHQLRQQISPDIWPKINIFIP